MVSLTLPPSLPPSLPPIVIGDADYTSVNVTVTFPQNESRVTFRVPILSDSLNEGIEDFTALISVSPRVQQVVITVDEALVTILRKFNLS